MSNFSNILFYFTSFKQFGHECVYILKIPPNIGRTKKTIKTHHIVEPANEDVQVSKIRMKKIKYVIMDVLSSTKLYPLCSQYMHFMVLAPPNLN